MDEIVRASLEDAWGVRVEELACIAEEEGRRCYRARGDHAQLFVKAQHAAGRLDRISQALRVQTLLASHGIAAARPVTTAGGALLDVRDGYAITVESWIPGGSFTAGPGGLQQLGRLVGRLHSLPVSPEFAGWPSRFDPAANLNRLRGSIADLARAVPDEYGATLAALMQRADDVGDLAAMPGALVHGDLAWSNVLEVGAGQIALLDFEDSGIGQPIVDLVEVTTYLVAGPSASGPLRPAQAEAFYAGYRESRVLTDDELAHFAAAHFFHQLVHLENALGRGDHDFIRRMAARLESWDGGVVAQIAAVARGAEHRNAVT